MEWPLITYVSNSGVFDRILFPLKIGISDFPPIFHPLWCLIDNIFQGMAIHTTPPILKKLDFQFWPHPEETEFQGEMHIVRGWLVFTLHNLFFYVVNKPNQTPSIDISQGDQLLAIKLPRIRFCSSLFPTCHQTHTSDINRHYNWILIILITEAYRYIQTCTSSPASSYKDSSSVACTNTLPDLDILCQRIDEV